MVAEELSKTKIVATLGPASKTREAIEALLLKGVEVFRLNFSHGTHEDHEQSIRFIRELCAKHKLHSAILADLQGPKIRTGKTEEDRVVHLETGSSVRIVTSHVACTEGVICTDYPELNRKVSPGQLVMINDGAVRLRIDRIGTNDELICAVVSGGDYSSHKGVNLPDVDLGLPSLGTKDLDDLDFMLDHDVQFIAMSFVRTRADLQSLKRIVKAKRPEIKIIAKIEKPEAARNAEELLEECDGIMVARGDLGVEASPWEVPILQKELVATANKAGKLVIVATQMLESMIHNSLPTRAESSDVANAIIDGTDAVMLSGETAVGVSPESAVAMMRRIAELAESSEYAKRGPIDLAVRSGYPPYAVCEAAVWASRDMGDLPICVFTLTGETALYLAKLRNRGRVFAFTPEESVANMLSLAWGTRSFVLPFSMDLSKLHADAERVLVDAGLLVRDQMIVVVSGTTPVQGKTDIMRIKQVEAP